MGPRQVVVVAFDWTEFDNDGHSTIAAHLITNDRRVTRFDGRGTQPHPPSRTRTLLISAVGDCTLGGEEKRGPSVTPFEVEAKRHEASRCTTGGAFRFRRKPRYARLLKAGSVEVVSLTNNHSFDFGAEGYLDTVHALHKAGVGVAGEREVDRRTVQGIEVVSPARGDALARVA